MSFAPLAARLAARAAEIRPVDGAEVSWANFMALFLCAIFGNSQAPPLEAEVSRKGHSWRGIFLGRADFAGAAGGKMSQGWGGRDPGLGRVDRCAAA